MFIRESNLYGRGAQDHLKNYLLSTYFTSFRNEQIVCYIFKDGKIENPISSVKRLIVQGKDVLEKHVDIKNRVFEDPRIFYSVKKKKCYVLGTIINSKKLIQPAILHMNLNNVSNNNISVNHIVPIKYNDPAYSKINKNWTFFVDKHQQELVLTDLSPDFVIKKLNVKSGIFQTHFQCKSPLQKYYQTLWCTSAPIRWNKNYLICAGHTVTWKTKFKIPNKLYATVFIILQSEFPYNIVACTNQLYFFDYSQVEFLSGMIYESPQSFLLTIGLNNEYGIILRISRSQIINKLIYQF